MDTDYNHAARQRLGIVASTWKKAKQADPKNSDHGNQRCDAEISTSVDVSGWGLSHGQRNQ